MRVLHMFFSKINFQEFGKNALEIVHFNITLVTIWFCILTMLSLLSPFFSWLTHFVLVIIFVITICFDCRCHGPTGNGTCGCDAGYTGNGTHCTGQWLKRALLYFKLYNNPSYSRILIGSYLWSIWGQTHRWRQRSIQVVLNFLNFEFEPITILC